MTTSEQPCPFCGLRDPDVTVYQDEHVQALVSRTEDDLTGQGYNLVAHWKLHVIARYRGDPVRLEWHRDPDPGADVRARIAASIREHVITAT